MMITNTGLVPLHDRISKKEIEWHRIEQGMSWGQIGQLYFVSGGAVYKLARQLKARGATREDRLRIYRVRLFELDDGTEPAWKMADIVGCNEEMVRRVRKERGMDDCVRQAPPEDPCPRCTFPPTRENPMIGTFCLWCWCDLLSDPRCVPRGQRISYLETFCESGWAKELGLMPEPRRGKYRVR